MLAITGLNYVFGKRLLMLLIGPETFCDLAAAGEYLHNSLSWAFVLGLLVMAILWVRDNVPDRYDREWLRNAGR